MTNFWSKLRSAPIAGLVASAVTAFSSVWLYATVKEAEFFWLVTAGSCLFLALYLLDRNTAATRSAGSMRLFRLYWAFIPAFIFCFWVYLMDAFGYFDWGSLFLHADGGALTPNVAIEYFERTSATIFVIFLFLLGLAALKARGTLTKTLDMAFALFALVANPMIAEPLKAAILPNELGGFLAQRFVNTDPAFSTASTGALRPKNLVHIFIESAERTYMDHAEFDGIMDPLREFEARGLSAHDMAQLTYTYNSISGIVAANCGTPLFITSFTTKRFLEESGSFLPGAVCLGDILGKRGYTQAFVSGWPMDFTGQGSFFSTHGYSTLIGGQDVVAAAPGAGSPFGADDAQVLDVSAGLLREYKQDGRPFSLAIAVSGGHAMDGYLTRQCEGRTGLPPSEPNILHAVKCTNMLIADFIHKAEAEGLLDNTILVLQSDHLTQPSTVTARLEKYQRRNFFAIFGPGITAARHARPSSTPDIFPTILQALEIPVTDNRAALGVSLLSGKKTLVDELGVDFLNAAIKSENVLSRSLWEAKGTPRQQVAAAADGQIAKN
jgi:phosphoglycerol transferase